MVGMSIIRSKIAGPRFRAIAATYYMAITYILFAASLAPAGILHVPADQPTIQAGINAVLDGDTVMVAPGTYTENLVFQDKTVCVISSDGPLVPHLTGGFIHSI